MGFSDWLRRRKSDPLAWEIDDELDAHLALRVRDNLEHGMTPDDARREAARRLGSRKAAAAASLRVRGRGHSLGRSMMFDLRDAWRSIRRAPATALTGLLVAGIGLGAVFGAARLADSLLARAPEGIRQPRSLYSVLSSFDGEHSSLMTRPTFEMIRRNAPDTGAFVWSEKSLQLIHENGSRVTPAHLVSGRYFETLGVTAGAGRLLNDTDVESAVNVAVISDRLARSLLPSRDQAVGTGLIVNGRAFNVVGVARAGFLGIEAGHPVDVWLPVSVEPHISAPRVFPDGSQIQGFWNVPGIGWLRGGLRLVPGRPLDDVADRLTAGLRAIPNTGDGQQRILIEPEPWLSPFVERERIAAVVEPIGWAMLCTLLLTGACLGSLYVGRLSDRQQEFSLRVALGAGRWRLVRLASMEIAVVTLLGGLGGVLASELMLNIVGGLQLTSGVRVGDAIVPLDARAVGLLGGLVLLTTIAAALMPALFVRRAASGALTAGPRTVAASNRFRRGLMVAQVAAGCALLAGAVLLTQSIGSLRAQPLGFDADAVAFAELDPADAGLDDGDRTRLLDTLLASPLGEAADVAITDELPFRQGATLFAMAEDSAEDRAYPTPTSRVAGPYFNALGVRVIAGRTFTRADRERHVTILSEPLAAAYWPGQNPIGRIVRIGGRDGTPHEVVGVVDGLRDASLRGSPTRRLYLPFDDRAESMAVVARQRGTAGAPPLPALARLVTELDPRLVVIGSGTLETLAIRTIEQRLLFRLLTGTLGLGALLMVAAGVWGLSHGSLRRRWREFGIRQALGAGRFDVARLAFADARFVGIAGGTLGLIAGWQFGVILEAWLFETLPWNPVALGTAVALVLSASLAGAIWPARQASRLDAASLLRQD